MVNMKVADFFCGAGGFSEGFRMADFEIILAVDKWGPAIKTHEKNHPNTKTLTYDIEELSLLSNEEFENRVKDTEIIIGSPPCVAFSNSNKSGKGDKSLGKRLVESYLRIVFRKKYKKNSSLKYWILENVPNLKNHINDKYTAKDLNLVQFGFDKELTLQVINDSSGIYNAKDYGVAQNRKRFFCGEFPKPKKTIENENNIIPLKNILNGINKKTSDEFILDPNYHSLKVAKTALTDHYYIQEIAKHEWEKAKRAKTDKGYMGKMSFPENVNNPSRTIMATLSSSSRESIIYNIEGSKNRYRTPTIREVASIMSFPLDYNFYGDSILTKYRLVGNAVPPKLSFAFAKAIVIQENGDVPTQYIKESARDIIDEGFTNLNNTLFPIKQEKRKDIKKARYKYHIPYLIMNAYRVELTNYYSDFKNQNFKWNVELHKGQGKSKKVLHPEEIQVKSIESNLKAQIENFTSQIKDSIPSSFNLQKYYCMTKEERIQEEVLGPDEIMEQVKGFIESIQMDRVTNDDTLITLSDNLIPNYIGIGTIILSNIVNIIRDIDEFEESKIALEEK